MIMLPASMSSLFARNLSVQTLYLLVATQLLPALKGVTSEIMKVSTAVMLNLQPQ